MFAGLIGLCPCVRRTWSKITPRSSTRLLPNIISGSHQAAGQGCVSVGGDIPANMSGWPNVGLLLGQRLMFAGIEHCAPSMGGVAVHKQVYSYVPSAPDVFNHRSKWEFFTKTFLHTNNKLAHVLRWHDYFVRVQYIFHKTCIHSCRTIAEYSIKTITRKGVSELRGPALVCLSGLPHGPGS